MKKKPKKTYREALALSLGITLAELDRRVADKVYADMEADSLLEETITEP